MSKRRINSILAGMMLVALLSGCGDGSDAASGEAVSAFESLEAVQMELESLQAQMEQDTTEMKLLYQTGKLTEEEEAAVLDSMKTLLQNLEVAEYFGESIHMVSSEAWFETMSPGLYEGGRSYVLKQGEQSLLSVQVGYDIAGKPYSNLCYQADENSVILLQQAGSRIRVLQTGLSGGVYDGTFDIWQIDGSGGEIIREQGTYAQGIIVGEYTVSTYRGNAGDVFDLWTNRESMVYETKTMTYDESGQVIAEETPEPTAPPTKAPEATKAPTATKNPVVKPTPTPAPTQAPTPVPEPPAEDDEDDDDGGNNDDNGGNNDNSGGSSDNGGSTGGDTDIDWSVDLM